MDEQIARAFIEAGLPLPPVPARFARELAVRDRWCFATRSIDAMQMYLFDRYIGEALRGKADDYLAISHAGHGANSYALTYQLVDGPLVVIAQTSFGGVYDDPEASTAQVTALFSRCASLAVAAQRFSRHNSNREGRLCVLESDLRGVSAWGWLEHPLDSAAAVQEWVKRRAILQSQATESYSALKAGQSWFEEQMPEAGSIGPVDHDVFHVGIAGGSLSIRERRRDGGLSEFRVHRDEKGHHALLNMVNGADMIESPTTETYPAVDSLSLHSSPSTITTGTACTR